MSAELLHQFWYSLPRQCGEPLAKAQLKLEPEAFVVHEHLGFEFSGEGEHRWFYIEKRSSNTQWVAQQLAKALEVAPRNVGYSGLKDRHAVTRQWFSAPTTKQLSFDSADWRILEQHQHRKKCRRGVHKTNRFRIQITFEDEVSAAAKAALEDRWRHIVEKGVPNYFGEQRFGRDGANLAKLPDFLSGKKRNRDPQKRAMLYSAARAALFNQVLASYLVADGELPGYCLLPGQLEEPNAREQQELEWLSEWQPWIKGLRKAKVEAGRRPAWVTPLDSELKWLASSQLQLSFTLPRGSFATAVLRELVFW